MNICVFTHTYPRFPGDPVAPFMRDFCHGLAEQKQNVTLLAPYDKLFSLQQNTAPNLKIRLYKYIIPDRLHTLGYSKTLVGDHSLKLRVFFLAPLMFIVAFFSLLQLVRREKIQIISAHWIIPNGFIAALVSKITGIPLVITIPGSDVYLAKKNFLFKSMTKLASSQARIIVSNSIRYLEELSDLKIDRKKFIEIPYGVDVNRYPDNNSHRDATRQQLRLSQSDQIILTIGRLVEKKGIAYLISSMKAIAQKNKNAKLIIIGDGTEKQTLQQLAKAIGVKEKVLFLGKINHIDLPKYYAIASVYVAPSIKDQQGNLESHTVALFEAIASGLPIVATKLAVSKKYVIDGKNGYRTNDKDSNSLASSIIRILESNTFPDMGKYSKAIAKKYLSYQYCTNEYIKIFNGIIK